MQHTIMLGNDLICEALSHSEQIGVGTHNDQHARKGERNVTNKEAEHT